jgi:hypothetical protein
MRAQTVAKRSTDVRRVEGFWVIDTIVFPEVLEVMRSIRSDLHRATHRGGRRARVA